MGLTETGVFCRDHFDEAPVAFGKARLGRRERVRPAVGHTGLRKLIRDNYPRSRAMTSDNIAFVYGGYTLGDPR